MKDEYAVAPGSKSVYHAPGHVCFQYQNIVGNMIHYPIAADKNFNNNMVLFPANLTHCVHPFYSTSSYRISVSGNIDIVTTC
jgi:hypothetical protein